VEALLFKRRNPWTDSKKILEPTKWAIEEASYAINAAEAEFFPLRHRCCDIICRLFFGL
jgi:hypothetical protein